MLTDEQLNMLLKLIIKYANKVFVEVSEEDLKRLCAKLREYYAHAGTEANADKVRQVFD
jgi:hypothetical protein